MEEYRLFESIRDYIDGEARCFIVNEEATLGTLYEKIGKNFGRLLDAMYANTTPGASRSCIRNVCRRVSEFRDGRPVHILTGHYDDRVYPKRYQGN